MIEDRVGAHSIGGLLHSSGGVLESMASQCSRDVLFLISPGFESVAALTLRDEFPENLVSCLCDNEEASDGSKASEAVIMEAEVKVTSGSASKHGSSFHPSAAVLASFHLAICAVLRLFSVDNSDINVLEHSDENVEAIRSHLDTSLGSDPGLLESSMRFVLGVEKALPDLVRFRVSCIDLSNSVPYDDKATLMQRVGGCMLRNSPSGWTVSLIDFDVEIVCVIPPTGPDTFHVGILLGVSGEHFAPRKVSPHCCPFSLCSLPAPLSHSSFRGQAS